MNNKKGFLIFFFKNNKHNYLILLLCLYLYRMGICYPTSDTLNLNSSTQINAGDYFRYLVDEGSQEAHIDPTNKQTTTDDEVFDQSAAFFEFINQLKTIRISRSE